MSRRGSVNESLELEEVQVSAEDNLQRPLLAPTGGEPSATPGAKQDSRHVHIERYAVVCLLLQHISSTFTAACYDFASFLFLIEVFKDTLIPASLVGLFTKLAGLVFSGYVGGLVDRVPRLRLVRTAICAEKVFKLANYALFLILFGPLYTVAQPAFHGESSLPAILATWAILALTIAFSSLLGLANTALTVAIERDWVITIAQNDEAALTMLNTYIRRTDLLSKLAAPLFVSILTTSGGYTFAAIFLLAWVAVTFGTEWWWISVVYRRFPILHAIAGGEEIDEEDERRYEEVQEFATTVAVQTWQARVLDWVNREVSDWAEFTRLPIFCSSVAIAVIYLTTLSYDGTFIAYVKAARGWDDGFIAAMRGVCVITGLIGTLVMPMLERRIGLERAGAWSIWFEIGCLAPVMLSFFYGAGQYGEHGATWNSIVLFGGIALSRIGLWSFDLCQLKELQLALSAHPRRNRLTALQLALSNLFDLLKYLLTLSAATPQQFKWTALVSWLAVFVGGLSYAVYLRRARGHLVHLDWLKKGHLL